MKIFRSILSSVTGFHDWMFNDQPETGRKEWNDNLVNELRRHGEGFYEELPETEMDRLVKTIERMKDRHIHTY